MPYGTSRLFDEVFIRFHTLFIRNRTVGTHIGNVNFVVDQAILQVS
jgi:hypothetical protein